MTTSNKRACDETTNVDEDIKNKKIKIENERKDDWETVFEQLSDTVEKLADKWNNYDQIRERINKAMEELADATKIDIDELSYYIDFIRGWIHCRYCKRTKIFCSRPLDEDFKVLYDKPDKRTEKAVQELANAFGLKKFHFVPRDV